METSKKDVVMNVHSKNGITGVATQKVKSVSRLAKPYEGGDSLMEWHREKAKATLSEAYRDATYATAGWRTNSEWDDFVKFLTDSLVVLPFLGLAFYIAYEILVAMDVLVVRL